MISALAPRLGCFSTDFASLGQPVNFLLASIGWLGYNISHWAEQSNIKRDDMNIDDLTLGQIKQVKALCGVTSQHVEHPYVIGEAYLIRTVTHYYTGKLTWVGEHELVLDTAAWVADTGRYHEAFKSADKLVEVEPIIGPAIIGRGAVVDAVRWPNNLPTQVK